MSEIKYTDSRASSKPKEVTTYLKEDKLTWHEGFDPFTELKPGQWAVSPAGNMYKCLRDGSICSGNIRGIKRFEDPE